MSNFQINADHAATKAVVTQIRADLRGPKNYGAYVDAFAVTAETVKDHAAALAALVYPKADPVQTKDGKRTPYGNAVQAAATGLRRALTKDESDETGTKNLLTADGVKALAEMDDAALLAAVKAEMSARVK